VISGGRAPSDEDGNDSDAALGLALIKGFLLLNREQKLQVIQLVTELASSSRSNEE
jgi:hypothetical protein